jgi:hypothetical protein
MGSLIARGVGTVAALLLSLGAAPALQASDDVRDRPVSEEELRVLAAAYARGDLGSGDCDWVHPVTEGPTKIPCEAVPLPVLADMARNSLNKRAQLELGKRFEEGRGVAQDHDMARRYYRMARRDSLRGAPIFNEGLASASVSGIGGHTIYARPRAVGLPEAQERLRRLSAND